MNYYRLLAVLSLSLATSYAGTEQSRFVAPTTQQELDAKITILKRHYEPYLQSLPKPLEKRDRTALPKEWMFTFEARKSPKTEGIPPAPAWHTVDFDDTKWEKTTVPEWRYRVREGDSAISPKSLEKWKNSETSADTICWYRTTFAAPPSQPGQRQWLCFDGVDWEGQVYLNGELLGKHSGYYEPFRFDVTGKLKDKNTVAVRVISGRSYGQPVSYWTLFPDIRAASQRYTPDRALSILGNLPIGYHAGCGFGIHRDVYLERTGPVYINAIFARNDLSDTKGRIKIELDSDQSKSTEIAVELIPENFAGKAFKQTLRCDLSKGISSHSLEIPMPEAATWSPDAPNLYRCRVSIPGSDARDVLFGCRSFTLVKASGRLMLNGKPVYLRGTNIQGLNAYWYWGETNKLLDTLLLLKAGNFNAVRSCQHVEFPEVLEFMDRMGMMSEQDQGGGYKGSIDMGIRREPHIRTGTVLARQTYNNPGVVLLSFGNEHEFATEPIVRAALAVDPQRIFKPISGRFSHSHKPWDLPDDLRANAIDDGHPYSGWYGSLSSQTWKCCERFSRPRMVTLGEFGAEALDSYETMRDNYPPQFKPPAPESDRLWAASQVEKHDIKQIAGLGRNPTNLLEYIEASQNYQAAILADKVTGMRLSPGTVAGYFHFHFIDVIPVFWPKSIVSHDHRPKKAYYQLAQLNQPVVPLAELKGARPDTLLLWVANDLSETFPKATLKWTVTCNAQTLLEGQQQLDIPATGVVAGGKVDLIPVVTNHPSVDITLAVSDSEGRMLSRYTRTVRCVAETKKSGAGVVDPFNKEKAK